MDAGSISLALQALDFAIGKAKLISDLSKKAQQIEIQAAILELQEALLNAKGQNLELKEKIRGLEEQLALKESLRFDGEIYWKTLDGDEKDGPYCQKCWDDEKKLIRLQQRGSWWKCTKCRTIYGDNDGGGNQRRMLHPGIDR